MSNKAIAFVALSKGKKPKSVEDVKKATGYLKQYYSISLAAEIHKLEVVSSTIDHSTNPNVNWFSRTQLRSAIEKAAQNDCTLIIYDLFKLLSNCPKEMIMDRWHYLFKLDITIIDALSCRKLKDFKNSEIVSLISYKKNDSRVKGGAIKLGLKKSNHKSTPPSPRDRRIAQNARAIQAIAFVKSMEETLDKITTDLTKRSIKPTLQRIALELNYLGVPARRGGEWTATSVKRVLDRLKDIKK